MSEQGSTIQTDALRGVGSTDSMSKAPQSITEAIVKVMGECRILEKDGENDHGKYDFTSIDKFLEIVGGRCAAAGLMILQDEDLIEIMQNSEAGKKPWLKATYSFQLAHVSGAVWPKVFRRTVMVQALGGQSFGSAQSYCLKQFMRSLFQIATGDHDELDTTPQDPVDTDNPAIEDKRFLNRAEFREQVGKLDDALTRCEDQVRLEEILQNYAPIIRQMQSQQPGWWNGSGDIEGYKGRIEDLQATLPGLNPGAGVIGGASMIPVKLDGDSNPDWKTWAATLIAALDKADSLEAVNSWMLENEQPLANYAKANAKGAKSLKDHADKRRGFFAQAPAESEGDAGDMFTEPTEEEQNA